MPRFLPLALAALWAPLVAESQATSGLSAFNSLMSRSHRELAPLTFNQFGSSLFGAPSSNATFDEVEFGMAVDLASSTGTRLAVGAPFHDWISADNLGATNENGGAVYMYESNGTDWNYLWHMVGVPVSPGVPDGEQIGERLSLSADGTRIAVRRKDSSPHYVEVFDISAGGVETQVGLVIPGQDDGDTVTLAPNLPSRIAVSAESWESFKGRVEIWDLESGVWTSKKLLAGIASNDRFGFVTAFSNDGTRIAISSPNYDGTPGSNSGRVRIFDFDGTDWSPVGTNIFGGDALEQLGFSLDISGDGQRVVVGSPAWNATGTSLGKVGVYEYDGSSWNLLGSEIQGAVTNDRFGRSVSISDDGSRIAASSYHNNGQRGQIRFFELIGGVWTQLGGSIDGIENSDRLGYGVMSVSMTGDGNRIAGGSVWGDDGSGFSTGRVRVFDADPDDTSSPSMAPSSAPSQSAAPSITPTAIPNVVTDTPSMSPTVTNAPSASPSDAPSMLPTVSNAPTVSSVPSVFVHPDQFSWDIFPIGNATIGFNDALASEEIQFNYNISRRDTLVVIYEEGCEVQVPLDVIGVATNFTETSSTHADFEVDLDIKQDAVVGSGIWTDGATGVGIIKFCIRVDLLLDDSQDTSVHFHETEIEVTIDLTQGFTISEVLDLDRTEADSENQDAELDYTVTACQCNSSLICDTQTLTQGDDVWLCLFTNATNVEFVGIEALDFIQDAIAGEFTRSPVINGNPDALTALSFTGNTCSIRTQMASGFFIDESPADVLAQGVAVMAFTDGNRQLRAKIAYRDLQDDLEQGFEAEYALQANVGSSAAFKGTAAATLVALSGAFAFL